jgi:glycosyltransferase involved in cell wall biosynthesis
MSDQPQVSVIIPTYNRSEFLRVAVGSALTQTLQDLEIIVVDDASEENTEEVISQFDDKRVRLIRHETNQGVSAARNSGVMNSRGKYIAFLDDDDEWFPEKIERQWDLLEKSPKTVGVVYTGWVGADAATGRIIYNLAPSHKGDIFEVMVLQDSLAPTSSFFVRKECFEKVGLFDIELQYGEDFDMWLRIAREFQFDYLKEPLVRYSIPDNKKQSLSSNYELRIKVGEAQVKKYAGIFALHSKHYSRRYLDLGVLYCYTSNVSKGRAAFIKAIKIWPFEPRSYFNLTLSLLGPGPFRTLKNLKENIRRFILVPSS